MVGTHQGIWQCMWSPCIWWSRLLIIRMLASSSLPGKSGRSLFSDITGQQKNGFVFGCLRLSCFGEFIMLCDSCTISVGCGSSEIQSQYVWGTDAEQLAAAAAETPCCIRIYHTPSTHNGTTSDSRQPCTADALHLRGKSCFSCLQWQER